MERIAVSYLWQMSRNLEHNKNITPTREAAFAHAVTSAGVMHAVARACRRAALEGGGHEAGSSLPSSLLNCGCSTAIRPRDLHRDWLWGGCGDDLMFGYGFASSFIDATEKERNHPRFSSQLARAMMNLHNNEVGRQVVFRSAEVGCKCHGVSGSCSLRTCWQQLKPFRRVGERLMSMYDTAWRVRLNGRGTRLRRLTAPAAPSIDPPGEARTRWARRPGQSRLVYLSESPDYCEPDSARGMSGTAGRECSLDWPDGPHSCTGLCCRRGFVTRVARQSVRCRCRFHWCCRVQCEECTETKLVHVCK